MINYGKRAMVLFLSGVTCGYGLFIFFHMILPLVAENIYEVSISSYLVRHIFCLVLLLILSFIANIDMKRSERQQQ